MVQKSEVKRAALLVGMFAVVFITLGCLTSCEAPSVPAPSPRALSCCEQAWPGTVDGELHATKLTAYYPDSSALEGGFHNRYGEDLRTLQAFLSGKAKYVSTALDKNLGRVKRKLCSPDLNKAYGKALPLLVDDTGGAFTGKGFKRLDVCVSNYKESVKSAVNQTVDLIECMEAK